MAIRQVLRMGHPLLQQVAQPVADVRDPALSILLEDMFDTMAACNGAGLAAPQIGVSVRVVVFGVTHNPRYPQAEPVPRTVPGRRGRRPNPARRLGGLSQCARPARAGAAPACHSLPRLR